MPTVVLFSPKMKWTTDSIDNSCATSSGMTAKMVALQAQTATFLPR